MQLVLTDNQVKSLRKCLTSILNEAKEDYCGGMAVVNINEITLDFDKYQIEVLKQLVKKVGGNFNE